MSSHVLGYSLIAFPKITETFVLRELLVLKRMGVQLHIFSLLKPRNPLAIHPEVKELLPLIHYSPSLFSWELWKTSIYYILCHPLRTFKLLFSFMISSIVCPKIFMKTLFIFPKCIYFAKLAGELHVGHIHAHFASHSTTCARIIAHLSGIKYSVTVHAYDLFVKSPLVQKHLDEARFIVTISDFNRQWIVDHFGIHLLDRIHVVRCGIDIDRYKFDRSPPHGSPFRILCVAAMRPEKGHQFLLEALARLKAQDRRIELILIGAGPLFDYIEKKVKRLGIENCVTLLGNQTQNQVCDWLGRVHCFVLPSIVGPGHRMEGIPVSLMEAMAACIPVVGTRLSGIPELIKDHESGLLVSPGNVDELVRALSELQDDPERARHMGLRGHEKVSKEYVLENNVKILGVLFEDILKRGV